MRKRDAAGEFLMTMIKCIEMWEKNPDVAIRQEGPTVKFDGEDNFSRAMHVAAQNQNVTAKRKNKQVLKTSTRDVF